MRSPIARLTALANGHRSALEEIKKRSQELLAKGTTDRFVDKTADSGEVARLIERLREAIAHYQVSENRFFVASTTHAVRQISQQQAIYDRITNLTVSIFRFTNILHYTHSRSFHQVFIRRPLKTSRGDAVRWVCHDVRRHLDRNLRR